MVPTTKTRANDRLYINIINNNININHVEEFITVLL